VTHDDSPSDIEWGFLFALSCTVAAALYRILSSYIPSLYMAKCKTSRQRRRRVIFKKFTALMTSHDPGSGAGSMEAEYDSDCDPKVAFRYFVWRDFRAEDGMVRNVFSRSIQPSGTVALWKRR